MILKIFLEMELVRDQKLKKENLYVGEMQLKKGDRMRMMRRMDMMNCKERI